ncbi:MAG: type II toxin-antitoxin system VapC family toxin [Myxococcales bacterium]|nr:type II toxin-antitoxin system VapC family toxin [Myxococcales bacterium]
MEQFALDTSFLIDLQRAATGRAQTGAGFGALKFLRSHQGANLFLPSVARGEYLEGFANPESPEALALLLPLEDLPVTADVARVYAQVSKRLRVAGRLIGANDAWIGCTALATSMPLVTSNAGHFSRITDLVVIDYSKLA